MSRYMEMQDLSLCNFMKLLNKLKEFIRMLILKDRELRPPSLEKLLGIKRESREKPESQEAKTVIL